MVASRPSVGGRRGAPLVPSARSLGGAHLGRNPALSPFIRRPVLVAIAALVCAAPAATARRALFATDTLHNQLFGFGISTNGDIASLSGFPKSTADHPIALVPSNDGTRLYGVFSGTNSVVTYAVSSDGGLSSIGTMSTGATPAAAAVSPSGQLLFVANKDASTISRFAIGGGGSLSTLIPATSTGTGTAPSALAMTPNGAFLYWTDTGSNGLDGFAVGADGSLTPLGLSVSTGSAPAALAVTPDGAHLYAANSGDGTIDGWSIATDGSLTSVGDPALAGNGTGDIAISPDGARLVAANTSASTISRFLVTASGSLILAGPAIAGPSGALTVVTSPDGKLVFAAGTNQLNAYDFSPSGQLQLRPGSPLSTNGVHASMMITPDQGPEAKFFPVPAAAGQPTQFRGDSSLDPDGTVVGWRWDFGDGTTGQGANPIHSYAEAGHYTVTLTVVDNEGCSLQSPYTGRSTSCFGHPAASTTQPLDIGPAVKEAAPDPPCLHDGNDGFCGTPDAKSPQVTILGFNNGESITTLDAPQEIVGTVTPDPSGIKDLRVRFTQAAGTLRLMKTSYKKTCKKVKGKRKCTYAKTCKRVKGKRKCTRIKQLKRTGKKVPACLAVSGTKTYLVKYECSKVDYVTIPGDVTFRFPLPVALGVGTYSVDVIAVDGVGNTDVLEGGRNHMTFNVIKTPSNSGTGGGTTPTTGTTTPFDDTGSPFGTG
jgi:6-phosphogluconolactonase